MQNVNRLDEEERIVFEETDVSSKEALKHSCAKNHSGATAAAALMIVHCDGNPVGAVRTVSGSTWVSCSTASGAAKRFSSALRGVS
jgi:hypothetical protein